MRWWLLGLVVSATAVAIAEVWRRRREHDNAADYVQRIQVLASEPPSKIPTVKPLKAKRQGRTSKVSIPTDLVSDRQGNVL
jgi:hypothetical protein